MTSRALRNIILKLPEQGILTKKLEIAIGWNNEKRWFGRQKEHWLGWLAEQNGPGYYGRETWGHDAEYIYNHIQCAPMLLWLGEAVGISKTNLVKASRAASAAGKSDARQSAALRKIIPWRAIQERVR